MSEQKAESRKERREVARSRAILDVANELHMELFRSGRDYRWKEHDSLVISPDNNLWQWFSRHVGGDVISLVETIKDVNFNQAVDFLNDGDFKTFQRVERKEEPFNYYLKPYEQPFIEARNYLKYQRKLSDETIDFFLDQGVMAQANAKVHGSIEPVIVFKSLTQEGEIIGAQLQGIEANWEKWPERGYAKKIVNNSDGMTGLHVDIGQPKRLIFTESSIDLMSYYELHKDSLQDVRLVSMDGLKESIVGRHLVELEAELSGRPLRWSREELSRGLTTAIDNGYFAEDKHTDTITLAVDNDAGGRNFITSLQDKGVSLTVDIPDLPEGQEKADWNSYLQQKKQSTPEIEANVAEGLSLSDIQESLSNEGDLVSTFANDSSVLYKNTVNFDQAYSLNLEVHSPEEVDNLSDVKAPWSLEVTKDNQSLGFLAYGEDWGNDFNIEDELVNLDSWVTRNQVENHLYSQEEVNSFLKPLTAEKEAVGELKSYGTFIIDDDFLERRYGSEERDDNLTKAIDKAIKSITDSETYYLWHDEELDSLGASDQAFLEFHNSLQDIQYHKNGVNLFVAESSYDGATGFLSLEGNALNRDGIETYLIEKELSPDETLDFLNNLKIAVDETWVKVIDHYNEQFDVVISRFGLSEDAKKSPENLQETMTSNSEQIKKNETILGDLSEQAQEAAPVPEVIKSQPLKELSPTQSESHSLLHFTIQKPDKSMYKRNYHIIDEEDLFKLNNNADIVQNSARWYLDNLADRTIHYFYQKEDRVYSVNLHFEERHYMHLTGIFPIKDGQTAEKTLHDFAAGRGGYDNIMISNRDATFQKIKALPDMKAILNANSFYFDNVDDIPKLHSLTMEQAIQSDDKDVLLAFQSNGENLYPASLMEVTKQLKKQLTNAEHANVILGVYSEKDGEITPLSINHRYVSDNGEEMLSILQNKQYQEVSNEQVEMPNPVNSLEVTAEDFSKVLDAVYNNGAQIGKDNRDNIPEALHSAWDKYNEYAAQHDNDFNQIMDAAEKDHLLDKNSDFYKAWSQDDIYDNHYHVRLQELSDDIPLPLDVTEFIDYQTFAKELYQRNQESQSGKEITDAIVNFAIYAPGGDLIKEGINYHIGEESKLISRLLGLGYRRLAGYQELAQLDEEALSQLENQMVNQTIAKEANEPVSVETEHSSEASSTKEHVEARSEKELLKHQFKQRVEEILNDSPVQVQTMSHPTDANRHSRERSNTIKTSDYGTITPYELSQVAFQKIREYTQSPEELQEYLEFMSRFPHLSPRNVALIQAQWPDANAVATYNQWQVMGDSLGLSKDDVMQTKATYTNKRTGQTKEVVHNSLSVKAGETSRIRLFRPQMEKMIPVLDSNGNQIKNEKGNPKFKRLSQATPQEKTLVKEKKLNISLFQKRDTSGQSLYTTYKVFELSQTTLKPESYPKAMPNRHYNFDIDQVKTYEVLEGLCDYAKSLGVTILQDDAHKLGNIKGSFNADRQEIVINTYNTPGEQIATTIHELAHASLHNPKLQAVDQPLPRHQAELEAEMTSYLVSNHFGLDTGAKAIHYMAKWTNNLTALNDNALADSMTRIHKTVMSMVKHVDHHTKPYQRNHGQQPNFPKAQDKGLKR